MKKALFLLIILSVAFTTAYGQKKKKPVDNGSKPIAGNMGLGFRITGLNTIGLNTFNSNAFTGNGEFLFRYYVTQKIALRGALGIQTTNEKYYSEKDSTYNFVSSIAEQNGKSVSVAKTSDSLVKSSGFSFAPGIEYHLGTSPKLDPYVGAQIRFGYVGKTTTSFSSTETHTFNGSGSVPTKTIYDMTGDVKNVAPGGMQIGFQFLGGFNYFFSDHIAIGAEYSLGFLNNRIGGTSTSDAVVSGSILIGDDITKDRTSVGPLKTNEKVTIRNSNGGLNTTATGGIILSIFF